MKLVAKSERVPPEALRSFTEKLKADHQFVLCFVQKNGLCLRDVALPFCHDDLEIICMAAENEAMSLQFMNDGAVKRKLGANQTFMMYIMQ